MGGGDQIRERGDGNSRDKERVEGVGVAGRRRGEKDLFLRKRHSEICSAGVFSPSLVLLHCYSETIYQFQRVKQFTSFNVYKQFTSFNVYKQFTSFNVYNLPVSTCTVYQFQRVKQFTSFKV